MRNQGNRIKQYVLGIVTTLEGRVLLIRKITPEWQRGRLNGIGGKIEQDETPHAAMDREWREETGLPAPPTWDLRIRLVHLSRDAVVYFFHTVVADRRLLEMRDEGRGETLHLLTLETALENPSLMDNLRWMIPLFLDTKVLSRTIDMFYE